MRRNECAQPRPKAVNASRPRHESSKPGQVMHLWQDVEEFSACVTLCGRHYMSEFIMLQKNNMRAEGVRSENDNGYLCSS